jgi:hypothetical protein
LRKRIFLRAAPEFHHEQHEISAGVATQAIAATAAS